MGRVGEEGLGVVGDIAFREHIAPIFVGIEVLKVSFDHQNS